MIAWIATHIALSLSMYIGLSLTAAFGILMWMRSPPNTPREDHIPFFAVVALWPLFIAVSVFMVLGWVCKNTDRLVNQAADNALMLIGKGK